MTETSINIKISKKKMKQIKIFVNIKNIKKIIKRKKHNECEKCESILRCSPSSINPQNLPLLPIPKVENTLEKFIYSCQPFLNQTELENTKKICEKFLKKESKTLQRHLLEKAKLSENWMDEWYTQCAYLRNRDSLPMSTSPVMTFPQQRFQKSYQFKEYISKLILGALKFRKLCYCNELPIDTWHKLPLDMSVYRRLFSNIRLPKKKCDVLRYHPNSNHIIVMYNNNLFKMQVLNNCGDSLSYEQIKTRIDYIMTSGKEPGTPYGLLTSLNRDKWADLYDYMKAIPINEKNLKEIEKSIFFVNIDKESPCNICNEEDLKLNACQNGFHGFGPKINGANRWYGKTLQFFITRDGSSGIIFEHSPVEAVPLGKMADYIIHYIKGTDWLDSTDIVMKERPHRLNFTNMEHLIHGMRDASQEIEEKIKNFNIKILHYVRYGKNFLKEQKMSPDGIIQAALQLGHFRHHSHIVPQHETASMRVFYLGRTDTIRSCTNEVVTFIKAITNPSFSVKHKHEILEAAVKRHKKITDHVMMGKGIDRHLFGLLMASIELNRPTPKLFKSLAYNKSGRFKIVTRQNPTRENCFTCYAPGFDGGYGCCYNPRVEDINISVTSRNEESEYDPKKFLEAWGCSMHNISDLLLLARLNRKSMFCK